MINPRELRIWNWVYWRGDEYDDMPFQLDISNFIGMMKTTMPFFPIPLTPEILEKCGGKKTETNFYEIDMGNNIGQIHVNPNNGMVWIRHHRIPEAGINPMSGNQYHLHQLQNLYFALTGEELNYKP